MFNVQWLMVNKVRAYIEREIGLKVFPKAGDSDGGCVLVALSGGADSTALLLIMKELRCKVEALHCNFHLRGEESDRDQAFVEELCRQQQVPLSVRHFQTEEEAKHRGISIEMAARDLRYEWFREVQAEKNSTVNGQCLIAIAHHRDDQAETLLLNLLRGTGLRGLAGMHPMHDGIIRPLLCLSREEILAYLEQKGQSYVTDSTNSERIAQRNRIRLDLMPLLQSINPTAVEHLSLACDIVRQSLPYYKKGIEAAFKEHGITEDTFPLSVLIPDHPDDPIPNPLLHEWLAGKGFNGTQEEEILQAAKSEVGKMWHSRTLNGQCSEVKGYTVLRDRESLKLAPISPDHSPLFTLHSSLVSTIGETGPNIAYFDADLLTAPIEVRPVREGDAFVPFGMKGRKLVSDYLTDCKVDRLEKAKQYVATCGDDIIWLIGHRSDNRYRVTASTTRILKLYF
ncbi:MAG: tRNA lysidine(34) synthetase TilS [Bacteroidaceae bacterium]|nr:tRNA lysidine(34) synthetase TilS [Bacteroidaceae bacterium]